MIYLKWRTPRGEIFEVAVTFFFLPSEITVKRHQDEDLTRNRQGRIPGTDPGTCIGA